MRQSFTTWLDSLSLFYCERPAITCGTTMIYEDLFDASKRCAMILNQVGVQRGDRVELWAANGTDWIVSFFGIVMAGGVAVLMNYGIGAEEITRQTKKVQAGWAIIGANKVSVSDKAAAVRAVEKGGVLREHVINIENLWRAATDLSQPFDKDAFRELTLNEGDDSAQESASIILFTSDAASKQKPVQLSASAVLNNVNAISTLLAMDMTDSLCDALPLFDSFGLMMLLTWLNKGYEVYILPNLNAEKVMETIYMKSIAGIASMGALYSELVRIADFEDKIGGLLTTCIVADGFTTPTEMMRFENSLRFGKFLIGYGQAESTALVSINTGKDTLESRAASVGYILPGTEVKIWREDTGFLKDGEIGEIIVKGPGVMLGYCAVPRTEQPFDTDGWLHTGDLGRINEYGLLELKGSINDIIIRSGEKISPMEIENVLTENPTVREAKVFGAPHPIWGESVEACVVPEGDNFDIMAMLEYVWRRLPSSKIPSHIFSYTEFPMNDNGRIDQTTLKADMLEKLRALSISSALSKGISIMNVTVGNRVFTISSVCGMVQDIAEQLSFKRKQVNRIRLAVEEMLTERITNAYDGDGNITMEVVLMPQWFRIRFVDSGKIYRLDDRDASISAKIILANVDAYSSVMDENDKTGYNLDWQYSDKFDIQGFLKEQGF